MDLSELVIVPIAQDEEARFNALMDAHHYLSAPPRIGRSAFYAAVLQGRWMVPSSFCALVLKSRSVPGNRTDRRRTTS